MGPASPGHRDLVRLDLDANRRRTLGHADRTGLSSGTMPRTGSSTMALTALVLQSLVGCSGDPQESPADKTTPLEALAQSTLGAPSESTSPSTPVHAGSACDSRTSCERGATCLRSRTGQGVCSLPCTEGCPDASSFCAEHPEHDRFGLCLVRCDWQRFPSSGCGDAAMCRMSRGFLPQLSEPVCVPLETGESCMGDEVSQPNLGVEEPPGLDGCPPGMARIEGTRVCIDRWEAHLVLESDDGATQSWSPFFNPGPRRVRARSAPGAVPQGYVDGFQAARACLAAGKRLCTRWQWTRACRGRSKRLYPYGDTRVDGACNDRRARHPLVEYFDSKDPWIWKEMGHSCINQLPEALLRTGQAHACRTPEGVHDLVGNLHEWVDDPKGTFLGGFFVDATGNGEGCRYATVAHGPKHWDYSTGFRCCASLGQDGQEATGPEGEPSSLE
jgi:sulfatase modifying factor 1